MSLGIYLKWTANTMATPSMNILIFSTAYYPMVGGAEVAIREITNQLKNDYKFDLITAKILKNTSRVEKIDNVTVYRIGFGVKTLDKLLLPFWGAFLAGKLHGKNSYFCFWGMMATFGSGAGYFYNIVRALSGEKKIPMILTLQEGDSEEHLKYKWLGLIALSWKLALKNTDSLTAISNFLLNRAKKNGYNGPSFLVPNGVDLKLFTEEFTDEAKNHLKNKLNKKDGDIFLVTTGRLTHKNAVDDIITALSKLPEKISLVVIGKGEGGFALQRLSKKLNVESRVKFLGLLPYKDIPLYLSVCDIFIRPSRSEGFGNSFIEAMAAGLPVIATPVGGIVDFLDDRKTGIFCSPDNPKSIVEAVNFILNEKEMAEEMVRNAKERVLERYGWDKIALEMKSVFERFQK
jgi:glycosyltransferase involved in cell wall biosynthesis